MKEDCTQKYLLVNKKPDLHTNLIDCKNQCHTYILRHVRKKEAREDIAPIINPEERPDLQDFRSTDKESGNINTCQDCGKVFSSKEELAVHYNKDHAESF